MGQKLGAMEFEAFMREVDNPSASDAGPPSQHGHKLQVPIAALGLLVHELRRSRDTGSDRHAAVTTIRSEEDAMTCDCLDLIEAYTRISDPEERQRLLKIVRDTAGSD